MKKALVAATFAALLGFAGAASAADIYAPGGLKDGPAYVPETSWTGFYVGVGVGGAGVNHDLKFGRIAELDGLSGNGVFGTVEVGYDRQFGNIVGGIFFNYDFADVSTDISVAGQTASAKLNDTWSVGGRLGYLVNPGTLAYALAAYTEANIDFPFGIKTDSFSGYSVGGGLETKLGGNWFLKGEYRFTRLDTETLASLGRNFRITDDVDLQTARLVLSYKGNFFDSGYAPLK